MVRTLETLARAEEGDRGGAGGGAAAFPAARPRPRPRGVGRSNGRGWRSGHRWPACILERNIALGDLVDTSLDLFKIADLSRLRVIAHAYEEQLRLLDALPESLRRWTIRVDSDPALAAMTGRFEQIGKLDRPERTRRVGDRLGG